MGRRSRLILRWGTTALWLLATGVGIQRLWSYERAPGAGADAKVVAGFIYVGPKDDYGYNQAHAEGKVGVSKLPWVKSVEEASVPETTAGMIDRSPMIAPPARG